MFENKEWKEGADKEERVVEIDDIEGPTMEYVLRYIYTGYISPDRKIDLPSLECD